jgi:hypothetical protein
MHRLVYGVLGVFYVTILLQSGVFAGEKTEELRKEVASLEADLQDLQSRASKLTEKEDALAAEVRKIKESNPLGVIQDFLLRRKLRKVRDMLNELNEIKKNESEHRQSLAIKKKELQQEIRTEVDRILLQAESAYRQKKADEAEALYRESLKLLQELEAISQSIQRTDYDRETNLSIKMVTTGLETPEELREIAKILVNHSIRVGEEIQGLERRRKELSHELLLKQDLYRFQGVIERSNQSKSGEDREEINRQIKETESRISKLKQRIQDSRKNQKALLEKAKTLETDAHRQEKDHREEKEMRRKGK